MTPLPDGKARDGLPNPQRMLAFATLALGTGMAVLDGMIVNVALPTMARELDIAPAESIWIVNAFQLAVTASLLPLASLGERLGYRRVYWPGLALFTAASFACAIAPNFAVLALARAVQGLGAAGVMSVSSALVRFVYPSSRLGQGVGNMAVVVAVASAASPTVAAAILSVATWRWLFLVNVPIGVVALTLASRTLPATPRAERRFDGPSVLFNALTFGLLIAGIDGVGDKGNARFWALELVGAAVFCILLVRRQLRLSAPLLPIDLLRRPVFALSLATSASSYAAQSLALVALPFFFEDVLGRSPTATGLLMTPWPVATALIAPVAGRLADRLRPGPLGSAGLLVMAAGLGFWRATSARPRARRCRGASASAASASVSFSRPTTGSSLAARRGSAPAAPRDCNPPAGSSGSRWAPPSWPSSSGALPSMRLRSRSGPAPG